MPDYYTYILRCKNGSLYTGITTDIDRRFSEHTGKLPGGAKYTRANTPIKIECAWLSSDKRIASRLEWKIKHLSKLKKEELVKNPEKINFFINEDSGAVLMKK